MRGFIILTLVTVLIASCKTEFEAVRTSNDAERIYKSAEELFATGDYNRAIILYELAIPAYRGKIEAEKIYFNYANANYLNQSYTLSAHYFKTFADTYTTSTMKEEALFKSAYSYYLLSPRHKLDQTETNKAVEAFQLFANAYPNSEKIPEVNQYVDKLRRKMETKAFEAAKLYYDLKNYGSAIQSFENLLKDYPGSPYQEQATFFMAKASYEHAVESIYLRQEERYRKTAERAAYFLKKYPNSQYTKEILGYQNESLKELNRIQNG